MKIVVYGAGVVGSFCAARLLEAGNEVAILARGRRLEELREHGVVLEALGTGQRTAARPAVVEALGPDDAYELALVCLRHGQVEAALPALAANRATPAVAFIGNSAAGPAPLVAALGRERVLMGFVTVGGVRDGHVVRHVEPGRRGRTVLGELDGRAGERLERIARAFAGTGVPVAIERDVDSWLKTHAAAVVPLAHAVYLAGGDVRRLARTRDGLVLAVRAVREGFEALRVRGVTITPPALRALELAPEPILVALLRRLLATPAAELAIAGHANVARDEMDLLARELEALVRSAGVPATAFAQLRAFIDPAAPAMREGRSAIPVNWRGVWVGAGAVAAAVLLVRRLLPS